jgi:hypothetical protein
MTAPRIDLPAVAPDVYGAMANLTKAASAHLDPLLAELVRIRVSQSTAARSACGCTRGRPWTPVRTRPACTSWRPGGTARCSPPPNARPWPWPRP